MSFRRGHRNGARLARLTVAPPQPLPKAGPEPPGDVARARPEQPPEQLGRLPPLGQVLAHQRRGHRPDDRRQDLGRDAVQLVRDVVHVGAAPAAAAARGGALQVELQGGGRALCVLPGAVGRVLPAAPLPLGRRGAPRGQEERGGLGVRRGEGGAAHDVRVAREEAVEEGGDGAGDLVLGAAEDLRGDQVGRVGLLDLRRRERRVRRRVTLRAPLLRAAAAPRRLLLPLLLLLLAPRERRVGDPHDRPLPHARQDLLQHADGHGPLELLDARAHGELGVGGDLGGVIHVDAREEGAQEVAEGVQGGLLPVPGAAPGAAPGPGMAALRPDQVHQHHPDLHLAQLLQDPVVRREVAAAAGTRAAEVPQLPHQLAEDAHDLRRVPRGLRRVQVEQLARGQDGRQPHVLVPVREDGGGDQGGREAEEARVGLRVEGVGGVLVGEAGQGVGHGVEATEELVLRRGGEEAESGAGERGRGPRDVEVDARHWHCTRARGRPPCSRSVPGTPPRARPAPGPWTGRTLGARRTWVPCLCLPARCRGG